MVKSWTVEYGPGVLYMLSRGPLHALLMTSGVFTCSPGGLFTCSFHGFQLVAVCSVRPDVQAVTQMLFYKIFVASVFSLFSNKLNQLEL